MSEAGAKQQGADGGGEPTVIRDRRRIDPQTGQVRDPGSVEPAPTGRNGGPPPAPPEGDLAAERLADLQRLQAEYVNYRKRVERDRDVAREAGAAKVVEALLPVLDDVHLARQHGDLEAGGPFAAIADKLEAVLARQGLTRFGEVGEPFDPTVHEALMHTQAELAEGTEVTTVVQVLQPGYRSGERVLRAARVAVADPAEPTDEAPAQPPTEPEA